MSLSIRSRWGEHSVVRCSHGFLRSGERRVGEEGRSRGGPGYLKKKKKQNVKIKSRSTTSKPVYAPEAKEYNTAVGIIHTSKNDHYLWCSDLATTCLLNDMILDSRE